MRNSDLMIRAFVYVNCSIGTLSCCSRGSFQFDMIIELILKLNNFHFHRSCMFNINYQCTVSVSRIGIILLVFIFYAKQYRTKQIQYIGN